MGHKEEGKTYFQNEDYEQALISYREALNPEYACPYAERQILLSVRTRTNCRDIDKGITPVLYIVESHLDVFLI